MKQPTYKDLLGEMKKLRELVDGINKKYKLHLDLDQLLLPPRDLWAIDRLKEKRGKKAKSNGK